MIISDTKKFIFFHLYKTAGTSLSEILKPHSTFSGEGKHFKVFQYLEKYGKDKYNDYFTFGFVRNPWDWQVSLYHYMLMDKNHFQHNLVKSFPTYNDYLIWRINEDCKPQYTFFSERGDEDSPISIDFIGKFENLQSDFELLKTKVEIGGEIPHLVKSNHTHYKDYYNQESWDMLEEAYKKDVEYFGYNNITFE
jgi:hypothetical protein